MSRQVHMDQYLATLFGECLPRKLTLAELERCATKLMKTVEDDVRTGFAHVAPASVQHEIVGRIGAALAQTIVRKLQARVAGK